MGKKKNPSSNKYPLVSLCTPTFNRRPFVPIMLKCFENQTYPKDRIEWIIIDDGTDKIGDLLTQIPQIQYFAYEEKMTLGKKRNLAHEKCKGDIIVYIDDDDYYPPERISHAVETLQKNPQATLSAAPSTTPRIYRPAWHIIRKIEGNLNKKREKPVSPRKVCLKLSLPQQISYKT